MMRGVLVVLLALFVAASGSRAAEHAQPAPADGKCSVGYGDGWTPAEKFAWDRICRGEVADFNIPAYGGDLDPATSALPESRVLTSRFLETILLKDEYRHALTHHGVRIRGARFKDKVDLENAELEHELWLDRSLFENGADLSGMRSTERVTFDGSRVNGLLNMSEAQIGKDLAMRAMERRWLGLEVQQVTPTVAEELGLEKVEGVEIGGAKEGNPARTSQLHRNDVIIRYGTKDIKKLRDLMLAVAESEPNGSVPIVVWRDRHEVQVTVHVGKGPERLIAGGAEFDEIRLSNARVEGLLFLAGAKVTRALDMEKIRVDGNLIMRECPELPAIQLLGGHIAGQLILDGSTINDRLDMDEIEVGETIFLSRGADFAGKIVLVFAKVGDSLELVDGTFHDDVDLTGTQIGGELRAGVKGHRPSWPGKGKRKPILLLRNARVDAVQDVEDAWPDALDLTGFTYRSLGGLQALAGEAMADRPAKWFEDWLAKQVRYSPQPYQQLAAVLRSEGRPETADDILYAGREKEREHSSGLHWLWLSTLWLVIGYGFHVWRAVIWAVILLLLGTFVHWTTTEARKKGLWRSFLYTFKMTPDGWRYGFRSSIMYSFEMLLPLVRLRGQTREYRASWQHVYFHLHNLIGLALAAFLAAGLSGLTK